MATLLIDRYRRWFEHEKDCHAKVMASFSAVSAGLRSDPAYGKAVGLLAHVVRARRLWLFRLGAAKEAPREFFPEGMALDALEEDLRTMHAAWDGYLARLDDAALARVIEYRSLEGPAFRSSLEDILTQLAGHAWYHRGQIATLVRSIGAEPARTDFIYWTREPVEPA